jgi:hypothetical protein
MSTKSIDGIRKWFARVERRFALTKRQQFVLVTTILTLGLLLTQLMIGTSRYF